MSDGGKGSKQRPFDKQKFDESYDRIFGNKPKRGKRDLRPNQRRKIRAEAHHPDRTEHYGGTAD